LQLRSRAGASIIDTGWITPRAAHFAVLAEGNALAPVSHPVAPGCRTRRSVMEALLDRWGLPPVASLLPIARSALHVTLIAVLAWAVHSLGQRIVRAFRTYMSGRTPSADNAKRIDTLARVFRYSASVVITLVAGMLILAELGISIAPILGAAGVVGIAVGFGAQSLIKDYFNGFFLLIENQVRVGDVVDVGGKGGLVEELTLRYIRLRDYDGNVHYVPNGLVSTVTNRSRDFAFAVMDVRVAYRESVDEALEAMREVGAEMQASESFGPRLLDELEIAGVEAWGDSSVVLRCRLKVRPLEQWNVRREFLRRLKKAFESHGIEIPYQHLTLFPGEGKDGSSSLLRFLQDPPVRESGNAKKVAHAR